MIEIQILEGKGRPYTKLVLCPKCNVPITWEIMPPTWCGLCQTNFINPNTLRHIANVRVRWHFSPDEEEEPKVEPKYDRMGRRIA